MNTGSEGDTCSSRPSRAPAGLTRSSSVLLAGRSPAVTHVVGERRHGELLGDLRLADERAAPRRLEVALARESPRERLGA